MGQLEVYSFHVGVVISICCALFWGKTLDSGVDGFLGAPDLGEGGKELLIFRMEPELVYWVPVAIQIPGSALSGRIQLYL